MAKNLTNKFTKSVLEREQKEQRIVAIAQPPAPPVPTQLPDLPQPSEAPPKASAVSVNELVPTPTKQPTERLQSKPKSNRKAPAEPPMINLDAFLIPEAGRQAKNKTFYLDAAVIIGIKRAATANNIAESKLVNDILKKILGV